MKTALEMARESNLLDSRDDWGSVPIEYEMAINAFAALVRADEREACAKVCEENAHNYLVDKAWCAEAIRARSNT